MTVPLPAPKPADQVAGLWQQLVVESVHLPSLGLQVAAVLGLLSMVLMFRSRRRPPWIVANDPGIGLVLGTAAVLLSVLSQASSGPSARPFLGGDLLFLSGLLGGWRAALWCLLLVASWRLADGGMHNFPAALLDLGVVALSGALAMRWLPPALKQRFGIGLAAGLWLLRTGVSLLMPALFMALNLAPYQLLLRLETLRVMSSPLSLLLFIGILAVMRRDQDLRQAHAAREHAERTDTLTGLPNRRALRQYLEQDLSRHGDTPHTLVLIEVTNQIDMTVAHGDEWNSLFWQRMAASLRQGPASGLIAAYQPGIFLFTDLTMALVLHGVHLQEVARSNLITALDALLTDTVREEQGSQFARLRYGVVDLDRQADTNVAATLRNLNLTLRQTGTSINYFDRTLGERADLDERIRKRLLQWIASSEAPLMYQPKCDLASGRIVGAEALLRCIDVDGQRIAPPDVLTVAAHHQLVSEFEWATLETAVRALRLALDRGRDLPLSVNISATSLVSPHFGSGVVDLLNRQRVPGSLLMLEMTEDAKVPDDDAVLANLRRLAAAGVGLSLDDFGTGYSALAVLARFPFCEIKLDHTMVARLDLPRTREAVSLALECARRYQTGLVAEGIETPEQFHVLRAMGVPCGQGYLFAPAIDLDSLLARGSYPLPSRPAPVEAPVLADNPAP